ncbi:MAG: hypothetical protein MUC60_08515 [Oscillatoria sp. Prado101]|nr:hypothetical protein [Oscillatoria sp. Prado101]
MAVSTPHRHLTPDAYLPSQFRAGTKRPRRPPRQHRGGGSSFTRPAAGFAKGARL